MKQRIKSVILCVVFVVCSLLSPSQAFCWDYVSTQGAVPQENQLTGTVKDINGEPIIGATIQIKGTTTGTATDVDGHFTLAAPSGAVLEVSFVGYKKKEITVGAEKQLNIILEEDIQNLEEVVVTALGIRKTNRKIGYAMSTVKGDELQRVNNISPISALQGKVAGVDINIVGSSGVQSSPSIVIRGAKSLSKSAQPIFVIDGIVMENNESPTEGADWGSQLKNLNPDDYADITVLKGAAATALYGNRGANGAVVITSKTGEAGKGIGVEISHTQQWETIYKSPIEYQDVFGMGYIFNGHEGGFGDDGNPTSYTAGSFGPRMEGQMIKMPYTGELVAYSPQKDNWKTFYQTGAYRNTNVAISGGSEKATYRFSYSNTDNKGVLPNNQYTRNSLSLRSTAKINQIFSLDFGAQYVKSVTYNAASTGRYYETSNMGRAMSYCLPRSMDVADLYRNYRNEDGTLKDLEYGLWNDHVRNILDRMDSRNEKRNEESFLANVQLGMQFTSWLDASVKVNYNLYRTFSETKVRGSGVGFSGGEYSLGGTENGSYNGLAMIHANRHFIDENLELDVRVATEIYGNNRSQSWSKKTNGGLIVPQVYAISNSKEEVRPVYDYTPANNRTVGLSGIVNLSWKDQVNLELTGRNDWLSTMLYPLSVPGNNHYSVFYPSVNVSWMFTDTFRDAIPEKVLTFGKLRGSLAYVGMGTAAYNTSLGGYNHSTIKNADGGNVVIAGVNQAGVLPNYDLKPELQRTIEFGADLRFFDSRFGIDFAWYKQNTKNQILTLDGVPEAGFTKRAINAGNIQNTGIEIQLDATPIVMNGWRWDIGLNFTRNRGKVKKLHPQVKEYRMMADYEGMEVWAYEGGQFGVMTTTHARAKDPNTGKYIVTAPYDYEGMTVFDYRTESDMKMYTENYKRTPLGNVQPDFLMGMTHSLSYKGFQFFAGLNARVGGLIYSNSYTLGMGRGVLKESLKGRQGDGLARVNYKGETVYDGFIPDAVFEQGATVKVNGQNVDISGMTYQAAMDAGYVEPVSSGANYAWNYGWQTNLDQTALKNTWVKLRELTLTYNFSKPMLQKIRLQGLQLSFSALNLCYIYNGLKGKLNPESIQSNNPFSPVEYGGVPFSRSFAVGVKVKF